jgi:RecA/RadA recombinase
MAKKKEEQEQGQDAPKTMKSSILSRLKKLNPDASLISESAFADIKEWIPTGNYALNCQISGSIYKGIPSNRIIGISGPSGTGKTYLALNMAREAQRIGYHVLYFDTEFAIDVNHVAKFGIDTGEFTLIPEDVIHNVKHQIIEIFEAMKDAQKAKKDPGKFIIIIDSIGNLKTAKEDADSKLGEHKRDMTRPSEIKSLFRTITVQSGKLNVPILFVNHTYTDTTAYVPTDKIAGGSGVMYNPSVNIVLSKSKLKEETKQSKEANLVQTGIIVTSKLEKSRFTKPITVKVQINFFTGMNKYIYLENYVDWETCGIQKGTLTKKIEKRPVLDENGEQVISRGKPKFEEIETNEIEFVADPNAKTWAVKHLGKNIRLAKDLFTKNVFTPEVLNALDKKMSSIFVLPEAVNDDEFDALDDDLEELGISSIDDGDEE